MNYEIYENREIADDFSVFSFYSEGPQGRIFKQVAFDETEVDGVYNLSFGSLDENGEIDDRSVTNNGDRNKILATVVSIVKTYTKIYPDLWIYFKGSTSARTRLYEIAISLNLDELSEDFEIIGYIDHKPNEFSKNMRAEAFEIKRKK